MTKPTMQKLAKKVVFSLILALVLFGLLTPIYIKYRPQAFELFAKGTQWVLIACGFVEPGETIQVDNRWRNIYYAARMFQGVPPAEILPDDAKANQLHPGMGFGLIHTFSEVVVPKVIGGWMFNIPCLYFADARDCQNNSATNARLKVKVADFSPISFDAIDPFLASASTEIISINIAGIEPYLFNPLNIDSLTKAPNPPPGFMLFDLSGTNYRRLVPIDQEPGNTRIRCIDPVWALEHHIFDHCLFHFPYNDNVGVELKFSSQQLGQWQRLQRQAVTKVAAFQVRR